MRSILSGVFVFALAASMFGVAAADELPPTSAAAPNAARSAVTLAERSAFVSADDAAGSVVESGNEAAYSSEAPAVELPPSAEPKHMNRLRRFASGIVHRSSAIASSLTRSAMRFIGTPYVFGGTRASGFDCSGYVQHVFALLGVHLPRTADAQFDSGHRLLAPLVPGDLVFFHTYTAGISHVGIYLGNSRFIHSSSSRGVAISSLHDSYWAPRFRGAKRVFGS